jgi:hypothetical protein
VFEQGERLFAFDVNSYSANRVSMDNGEEQLSLNPEDPILKKEYQHIITNTRMYSTKKTLTNCQKGVSGIT